MKLGSLIPEVNILLYIFCFRSMHLPFSLREHYPHFKILKCDFWFPLNSENVDNHPFLSEMSEKIVPPSARGGGGG